MNWLLHRLLDRATVEPRPPPEHEPRYHAAASKVAHAEARLWLVEQEAELDQIHREAQRPDGGAP